MTMGLPEDPARFRDLCRTFCDRLLVLTRAVVSEMGFADALRALFVDMRQLGRNNVLNRYFSATTASGLFEYNILGS